MPEWRVHFKFHNSGRELLYKEYRQPSQESDRTEATAHKELHTFTALISMGTKLGSSVQFSSVAHSWTLCDPMNRSMPGLPVHYQRPEFTQTHVHRVGDAIQPFHPLSSPSPPAPNPFQHQGLFQVKWFQRWKVSTKIRHQRLFNISKML